MARIRALLRRVEGEEILRVADLEIDTAAHIVRRGERRIELTAREYELLVFMARNARRALSREMILSRVWEQNSSRRHCGRSLATSAEIDVPGEAPSPHPGAVLPY